MGVTCPLLLLLVLHHLVQMCISMYEFIGAMTWMEKTHLVACC